MLFSSHLLQYYRFCCFFFLTIPRPPTSTLFPYTTLFRSDPALAHLDKIKTSPSTGVHFWFDRPVLDEPFVTLLDTTTQWIFNKTALYGGSGGDPKRATDSSEGTQYLQLVISASYDLLQKSREEIIDLCLAEVCHALPKARDAQRSEERRVGK